MKSVTPIVVGQMPCHTGILTTESPDFDTYASPRLGRPLPGGPSPFPVLPARDHIEGEVDYYAQGQIVPCTDVAADPEPNKSHRLPHHDG